MKRERAAPPAADGRLLRSERSRQRIADALYALIGAGDLEPSAQKVADRAEVGIRTVFRLFADMDALYATIDERLVAEVGPAVASRPPPAAVLRERIDRLVAERAALYERVGAYLRATLRHRSRSAFLSAKYRSLIRRLRTQQERWLPELRAAPADLVEALDQATSFEAWDRLRGDQRLSRPRARAAMQRAARALVEPLEERT